MQNYNFTLTGNTTRFTPKAGGVSLLVFLMLLVHGGCMSSGRVNRTKEAFMKQVYQQEIQAAVSTEDSKARTLSFQKALESAIRNDETLAILHLNWQKDNIDLKQAHSMLFPRLKLRVSNETYYGKKDKKLKNNIDAGFLLEYNVLNLLFQRDNISIRRSLANGSIIKGKIQVRNIYSRLMTLMLEIDTNLRETALRKKALSFALGGQQIAKRLEETGKLKQGASWRWDNSVKEAEAKQTEARHALSKTRRLLKYMVGTLSSGAVEISDTSEAAPQIADYKAAVINKQKAIIDAWNHRHEVKLAELDLFMAEMQLLKTKRNWLNFFKVSLGVGRFFIYRDVEQANITLNTTVALPILDMGDMKRTKKKAALDRDMARVKAKHLARRISREVREALDHFTLVREKLEAAENILKKAKVREKMMNSLLRLGRATSLDLFTTRVAALETESRYNRVSMEFQKAILEFKKASGTLMNKTEENKLMETQLKNENE
ncbi:MAG: TolC family protein, partial [bacterium]|nr:TolC family protein [bacterium]